MPWAPDPKWPTMATNRSPLNRQQQQTSTSAVCHRECHPHLESMHRKKSQSTVTVAMTMLFGTLLGKPPRTVNQILRTSLDHKRSKSSSSHHRSASAGDATLTTREVALPLGSAATPHPWVPRHARGHIPFTPYARSSLSKPPNWQPHRPCW